MRASLPLLSLALLLLAGCPTRAVGLSRDATTDALEEGSLESGTTDAPRDGSVDAPADSMDSSADAPDASDASDVGFAWATVVRERGLSLACAPGRWCWENPLPEGEALLAATTLADGTTWAVGPRGTALRYDGSAWERLTTATTAHFGSVWASSSSDVWLTSFTQDATQALTSRGLLRWDGTSLQPVALPAGLAPSLVHGVSDTEVWLLSAPPGSTSSTPWRYDGASFTAMTTGLPSEGVALRSLFVESRTSVWAYGAAPGVADARDLYRFDGARWSAAGSVSTGLALRGPLGGAAGEVYAYVVDPTGGPSRALLRLTVSGPRTEVAPGLASTQGTLFSGPGALWFLGSQPFRRSGGVWLPVSLSRPSDAVGVQPPSVLAVSGSAAWGFGLNGDLDHSTSPTQLELYSTPYRPSTGALLGRGAQPLGASRLEQGPLFPRSQSTDAWLAPGRGPGGPDVRDLVLDDTGAALFVLRSDGALQGLDASGAPAAVVSPSGMNISAASSSRGGSWAIAGNRVLRFTGSAFEVVATVPATVGAVDGTNVVLSYVQSEGTTAFVAGAGIPRGQSGPFIAVSCRVDTAITCESYSDAATASEFRGLWSWFRGGHLWAALDGRLVVLERDTLEAVPDPLSLSYQGATVRLASLSGNDRTGELYSLAQSNGTALAIRLQTALLTATLFPIPLSQYVTPVRSVYLGDTGTFWALSSTAQVLRYTP